MVSSIRLLAVIILRLGWCPSVRGLIIFQHRAGTDKGLQLRSPSQGRIRDVSLCSGSRKGAPLGISSVQGVFGLLEGLLLEVTLGWAPESMLTPLDRAYDDGRIITLHAGRMRPIPAGFLQFILPVSAASGLSKASVPHWGLTIYSAISLWPHTLSSPVSDSLASSLILLRGLPTSTHPLRYTPQKQPELSI